MGLSAVREDHVQFFDMVQRLTVDHRVGAAGVVAHAAADAGPAGGGGVRGIHQPIGQQLTVQIIQHDARLDPSPLLFFVDLYDLVQVLAEVGDDGMVHRLAG